MLAYPRTANWLAAGFAFCCATSMAQELNCCEAKPPIRPIDRTCLPAGPQREVPMFRSDLGVKYQEIANLDSFLSDNNCTDTIGLQLKDLQAKGSAVGADALIRVRMLSNKFRGYVENADTPFFSVKQGRAEDYFYRATAIKYLERVSGEPQAVASRTTGIALPEDNVGSADPLSANKLFGRRRQQREPNVTVPEVMSTNPRSF